MILFFSQIKERQGEKKANIVSHLKITRLIQRHSLKVQARDWSPKFATALNIIIGIVSKSKSLTKLSFCQHDSPRSTSFQQKNSLVTYIFFDLCLLQHLAKSQILVTSLYYLFLDFNLSRQEQEGEITISEALLCLRHNRIDHYLSM